MSLEDRIYPLLNIYKNLPFKVKYIIGVLYSSVPKIIKYGSFYKIYLNRIRTFKPGSEKQLLVDQLSIVKGKVPFYKKSDYEDLKDFPIINKEIIKESLEEFLIPSNPNALKVNTGGSSGNPFEFFIEKGVSRPKEKAHFDWYWKQFGYHEGEKMLMIRGESLSNNSLYEYQTIGNKLAISCYLLNEHNIDVVIHQINEFKPAFIHAYPSAIKNFIDLLNKSDVKLLVDIMAIFLGSEGLLKKDRLLISNYFNAKIAHWYGHSERLIHAGNCIYSDEFHIFPFYGFAELFDDDDELITQPNVKGRIVATGFDNSVMPFVRYETGDEAEYSIKLSCKCGFKGRSFKKIHGRRQDYIYLNDGTKVSLTAFIFGQHYEEFSFIKEIQLEQQIEGELVIRLSVKEEYVFDKGQFIRKLTYSVQRKLVIMIEIVNSIPKTVRGKHIFLIQRLK